MFDALFDGLAWLLAVYYTLGSSYGIAIMLFTLTVMLVLTPLTFYTTRSMLRMTALQPEIKKLQAQFQGDRQRMNEEMMRLYQANNVNPLGSCLPMLAQLPVFFVLFRLIRGLTRRVSDLGNYAGWRLPFGENAVPNPAFPERTFNPEYLASDSELRVALEGSTEMNFLSTDLSASLTDAFRDSFSTALPFLLLIVLIGVTSYIQQRQIAGRRDPDAPVNPQQQMIMKLMPWFLPIISVGFPAGLNLYFVSSNIVRVGQQAVITRRIYNPHKERQAQIESSNGEEEEVVPEPAKPAPQPMSRSRTPVQDHGSRRPTSRTPPKRRTDSRRTQVGHSEQQRPSRAIKETEAKETRVKDSKPTGAKTGSSKSSKTAPEQRQTSRTTQKGHQSHPTDRRRQRKKRRR
ncbi:YidC/Oxa1 family membrane protein insertase [Candidatus Poriferisocius sp.]|uniref:YidC/Oxa1 family membrane protein insertase n=1 Tax=Candidatus Poriferisocius sp. TaxID=3101276 RepID=UPI003B522D34